jgi:MerR family transcriptional regulator, copper efflux regulator
MQIGELSRRTGATAKAVRLYEAMGLLPPVRRRGTYRHYDDAHAVQVALIRRAQALGFRLAELGVLRPGPHGTDWRAVAELLRRKMQALRAEVTRLQALDRDATELLRELEGCPEAGAVDEACLPGQQ